MSQTKNVNRLWGGRGDGQPNQPRQFSPPIQPTDFPTRQIRLEFDQTCLPYYTEIDAVCLLGTLDPISPSARATAMLPPPSQQRWVVACCVVECC